MQVRVLDVFADPAAWLAVASGEAQLTIAAEPSPQGPALRLDFDFHGGGGFVVARRLIDLTLPDAYAFRFDVRGAAPANVFELKLADPTNANVWRWREPGCTFPADWRTLDLRGREFEYAWGPAGGGAPHAIGALEFAIVAGPGGQGTVWLTDLCLVDRTILETPQVSASASLPDYPPAAVLDGRPDTCWRAPPAAFAADLTIDFHEPREYGGLVLRWAPDAQGCAFRVLAGDDQGPWLTRYTATRAAGAESFIYLPQGESRLLRLELVGEEGRALPGLTACEILPYDAARSLSDWFHTIAGRSTRGRYPRWLYREQTYWTPVDCPYGAVPALLNEDGLVELDRGSCSLEPFLWVDGALVTWADCAIEQTLEQGELPIPSSVWRHGDLTLTTTVFATGSPGAVLLFVRYRLEDRRPAELGQGERALALFAAVRPFQVSPSWQAFEDLGGPSPVQALAWRDSALWVNGNKALVPLQAVSGVGLARFDQGPITDYLARGALPSDPVDALAVADDFGYASGALRFDLDLKAGGHADLYLVAPIGAVEPGAITRRVPEGLSGLREFARAVGQWSQVLGAVRFDLPGPAQTAARACKTAIAHVLVNRDGPALQPGPRRYTRSWIRDGAVMAAALLRLGRPAEAAEFIRWYAQFQRADGNVPCCVDRRGPDWLPEHDSHGEFIFAVADYVRFTGDRVLAAELWPRVRQAVAYLEQLRATR
ncbi:MAG TPA: discoidin domain-containing protein, partial [Lamprocystis sp. (in: g-proteobacteria)]|nr:discoidin domain-containing protein [Lamprocystis sp. (in: g-proteobacteria)]